MSDVNLLWIVSNFCSFLQVLGLFLIFFYNVFSPENKYKLGFVLIFAGVAPIVKYLLPLPDHQSLISLLALITGIILIILGIYSIKSPKVEGN